MTVRSLSLVIAMLALVAATESASARDEQAPTAAALTSAAVPFTSNGCSGFREETFFTCCFVHDFSYWAGGGRRDRSAADHALRRCVQDIGRDYVRSHIAFLLMRLGLGSGVFVYDGWGRAWRGTNRGRFTALSTDQRRLVEDTQKNICQSLTFEPAAGRYMIDPRFLRQTEHHDLRPREARELCGSEFPHTLIRAFVAVELDESLRREIARVQQDLRSALERSADGARVAWVRPASMHLTLKFLGDIDEAIVSPLHEAIAGAAREWRSIDIPLTSLGGFPRLQEPRNLWLGPGERWEGHADARRLQMLARAIDEAAAAQGVPREKRPFSPHLTLGRVKTGERHIGRALTSASSVIQALTVSPLPPIRVAAVALMKSQLDSKGAVHTRLWEIALPAVS